jgi:hypothetical protein
VENANEKIEMEEKSISCAKQETIPNTNKTITLEDLDIKKICKAKCIVCQSPHLLEIHELKRGGIQQQKIIEIITQRHGITYSASSISRHFSNLYDRQMEMSCQIINADLISEATAKSYHTQKVIALLQYAFDQIEKRVQNGTLFFDVSDLEKLMKMKYQTLTGNDEVDKDILAIFQKATDKYGVSFQQATLFNQPQRQDLAGGQ